MMLKKSNIKAVTEIRIVEILLDSVIMEDGFKIKSDLTCIMQREKNIVSLDGTDYIIKQRHLEKVMVRNTTYKKALQERLVKGQLNFYIEHKNILCFKDIGNDGVLAYRDNKRAVLFLYL